MITTHDTESPVDLSIVMPCLNEAETIGRCVSTALAFLRDNGVNGEVVVGDNCSTDGSQEAALAAGARVVPVPVRGYGAALMGAMKASRGRYIIMGDSDGSHDFQSLLPMLVALQDGADLVVGNRFLGGIMPGAMPWKNRYIGNPLLSWIGRLFFRTSVRDFHCGVRGITRSALRDLHLNTAGMEFASEMIIKAAVMHLKIVEVLVVLHPAGRTRKPHLRPWRDGWRHLRFMLLFSPRWLFFYPGLFLAIVGALGCALLLRGPVSVGGTVFDVHSLLFCAGGVIVGCQAIMFAVVAKLFTYRARLDRTSDIPLWIARRFSLEAGAVVGLLMVVGGFVYALSALHSWQEAGFGDLNPVVVLRRAIPAVFLSILGCQVLFTSFLSGVLQLESRTLTKHSA